MRNDVMYAVALLVPPPSTRAIHIASSAPANCQSLIFLANLQTHDFVLCRYANLFLHPVKEDDAPGYRDVIFRYATPCCLFVVCLFVCCLFVCLFVCLCACVRVFVSDGLFFLRPMDLSTIKKHIETGVSLSLNALAISQLVFPIVTQCDCSCYTR